MNKWWIEWWKAVVVMTIVFIGGVLVGYSNYLNERLRTEKLVRILTNMRFEVRK